MINQETKESIANWANSNPCVSRVYVFGSRVKGGFRANSDLDVAVEITDENANSDSELHGVWIDISSELEQSLNLIIEDYNVDLQWSNESYSKITFNSLKEASLLIYEKG